MMLIASVLITLLVQVAASAQFPNGTDSKLNFFSCNSGDIINVSLIELFDRNKIPMYPIKLEELASVRLKSYNKGSVIAKDKIDVQVYAYVQKDGKWKWKSIIPRPLQFLLNNIDGCKMAHNCPLKEGVLDLTLELDLYKYSVLFKFINKTVAHQFVIKMYDAETHEEISCETVQFKVA